MSRHVWTLLLASVQHNTLHATASVQCPYLENHGYPELVNLPPPSIYDLDSKPTATTNCFKTINCREWWYSFMIIWPIRGSVLHIRLVCLVPHIFRFSALSPTRYFKYVTPPSLIGLELKLSNLIGWNGVAYLNSEAVRACATQIWRCGAHWRVLMCRWLLPEAPPDEQEEDNFGDGCFAPTQKQLWNLFENPHHSRAAKVSSCIAGRRIYINRISVERNWQGPPLRLNCVSLSRLITNLFS